MNALSTAIGRASNALLSLVCLVAYAIAGSSDARPIIEFPINAISVSQKAGSVTIPVQTSGEFEVFYYSTYRPEFTYSTQAGTTKSGIGYEGTSGITKSFAQKDSTMFISIPIYYTGATEDLFFTVVLSEPYCADLGAITAVTVTIKGEKPKPAISILTTKGPLNKKFPIYGSVSNVVSSDIKSVTLTINGQKMNLLGKKNWKAPKVRASSPGTYKMVATAYLKDGTTLKKRADLYIY